MQSVIAKKRNEIGVTLIELVTVILILGILAAMVTPRFFDLGTFEERGFYEDVASALRYAQKIAIGSGCSVRVSITATSYDLRQQAASGNRCDETDNTWTTQVLMPDGTPATATAPGDITLGPVTNYVIDGLGQTDLGSDLTVTVGGLTMTVQTESGYVVVP
ncbi:MAG: prepilin-type N-terminal cleavage/methylation domain-containing protein [Woeseiaceae bacterium]|nr:prepilin-type N-terminal cleavage/methylation domain-containing protein [Woeseiaceae bacterium]